MTTTYTVCAFDREIFRESLRGLDLSELQAVMTTCREIVFGYTPELMRESIGSSHVYAGQLTESLRDMLGSVTGESMLWDGFVSPMQPAEWVGAMLYVAEAMEKYSADFVHPLETDYPAFAAKRSQAEARRPKWRVLDSQPPPASAAISVAAKEAPFIAIATDEVGEDVQVTIERIDAERRVANAARKAEHEHRATVMRVNSPLPLVDENVLETSILVPLVQAAADGAAANALYLPAIPDGCLQLSHLVTRCGLVSTGARSKKRKRWFASNPRVIRKVSGFADGSIEIHYSGEELRIGDIELWAKILDLARRSTDDEGVRRPLGESVTTGERELLLALNRGTGGTAFKTIRAERTRLQEGKLHIRATETAFIAQVARLFPEDRAAQEAVQEGYLELRTSLLGGDRASKGTWTVDIPRAVRSMFGAGFSAWFDEATYYSIKSDQARRLYLLYASHVNCYALSLPELKAFLGSTYSKDADFKQAMDDAHDELTRAGVIRGWAFKQPDKRRLNASCYEVQRKFKAKRKVT
mgnify:CR=1 FL=1